MRIKSVDKMNYGTDPNDLKPSVQIIRARKKKFPKLSTSVQEIIKCKNKEHQDKVYKEYYNKMCRQNFKRERNGKNTSTSIQEEA